MSLFQSQIFIQLAIELPIALPIGLPIELPVGATQRQWVPDWQLDYSAIAIQQQAYKKLDLGYAKTTTELLVAVPLALFVFQGGGETQ